MSTKKKIPATEQVDILRGAIEDIILDLENCGEVYGSDDARIRRMMEALEAAGLEYRPEFEEPSS